MWFGKIDWGRLAAGTACALALLLAQPAAQAAPGSADAQAGETDDENVVVELTRGKDEAGRVQEDTKRGTEGSDSVQEDTSYGGWFKRDRSEETDETQNEQGQEGKKPRFLKIISEENGFAYYLDTQNARWLPLPHSNSEQILDVWVKLVQVGDANSFTSRGTKPDETYKYPEVYYLEHYYLRPARQQIQFLCELEVTGRPQNAITERRYSAAHWEDLVPGSIEDEIYHAAVKHMKKSGNGMQMTRHGKRITVRDAIEEYFRISL